METCENEIISWEDRKFSVYSEMFEQMYLERSQKVFNSNFCNILIIFKENNPEEYSLLGKSFASITEYGLKTMELRNSSIYKVSDQIKEERYIHVLKHRYRIGENISFHEEKFALFEEVSKSIKSQKRLPYENDLKLGVNLSSAYRIVKDALWALSLVIGSKTRLLNSVEQLNLFAKYLTLGAEERS